MNSAYIDPRGPYSTPPSLPSIHGCIHLIWVHIPETSDTLGEWFVSDNDHNMIGRVWRLTEHTYEWEYGNPTDGYQGINGTLRACFEDIREKYDDGYPAC